MSRVARLSPELWTELFIENRKNLLFELDGFIERLTEMREAISKSDADGLNVLLSLGNAAKEEADRAERTWKKLNKDK
jgi:prephenate dehydrogenase